MCLVSLRDVFIVSIAWFACLVLARFDSCNFLTLRLLAGLNDLHSASNRVRFVPFFSGLPCGRLVVSVEVPVVATPLFRRSLIRLGLSLMPRSCTVIWPLAQLVFESHLSTLLPH